jgi:hypothetical protein
MLSPLRANRLVARLPCLSLNCTRNVATGARRGRPPKAARVKSEEASDTLPSSAANLESDASVGKYSLATSLDRYSSLPPLPPVEDWLSHFSYTAAVVRDRISIRTPASAIRVAHSFINSKKTFTGKPKVIVEAFPGVWCLEAVVKLLSHAV